MSRGYIDGIRDLDRSRKEKMQKTTTQNNIRRNVIRHTFTPATLQQIATVKVVTESWRKDVQKEMTDYFNSDKYKTDQCFRLIKYIISDDWEEIENLVSKSISKLHLPRMIKSNLLEILKPITKEIRNWINLHHLDTQPKEGFMNDLVWTSGGTIDEKETMKQLIFEDRLDIYEKYDRACNFCFLDHITTIPPKFFQSDFLESIDINIKPMLYFWTCSITKDKKLVEIAKTHNKSINEYVFSLVIKNGTDAAMKYLWNELSDEEKDRNIIPAVTVLKNADSISFLLSQMNKQQWREVFGLEESDEILLVLLFSWQWRDYFLPTMQNVWNIITANVFCYILKTVATEIDEESDNEKYTTVFEELWNSAPNHFKQYLLDSYLEFHFLLVKIFHIETFYLVKLMLSSANTTQRYQVIDSFPEITQCVDIFIANEWDFTIFIQHDLLSVEEVEDFKEMFVSENEICICNYFIRRDEWDKLCVFFEKCFKSEDQITRFKRGFAYDDLGKFVEERDDNDNILLFLLEKAVSDYTVADFTKLDEFLKWCFGDDPKEVINEFRKSMFEYELPFGFLKFICQLILNDEWEKIEDTLNWCFLNDPDGIIKFKNDLISSECVNHNNELIRELISKNDKLVSLDKFVNWAFANEEEINMFKVDVLRHGNEAFRICTLLLVWNGWDLLSEFVNWVCLFSQMDVSKFKYEFMVYDDISPLFEFFTFKKI
uniref:Uncharacterized protein n=1 Tax=Strigamia maritima TaxID=126957 RepID=T1JFX1_STRMM